MTNSDENTPHTLTSVPATQQWLATTSGRVAPDGYSWMQAVHWAVSLGGYRPAWSHGPRRMGRTTVRVAQELAQLSPCRPGIDFLARVLKATERTVQNHLRLLREAGLLVYIERGTRVRGERPRASEFALAIPTQFDRALGVRTAGEGAQRRMVGLAHEGRVLMGRLGRKATRKLRRARPRKRCETPASPANVPGIPTETSTDAASAALAHCTPKEGGSSHCSCDGLTRLPSESKLDAGTTLTTPQKKPTPGRGGRRTLNAVGRRHQLAWELIQRVPWLTRAAVPRIAWIVRDLADAGWTVDEVTAWLDLGAEPQRVRRPSGFLAARLAGATAIGSTPQARRKLVEAWRDNRRATADRHAEWDGDWKPPTSQHVRNLVCDALRPAAQETPADHTEPLAPEDLTAEQLLQLRTEAQREPALIWAAIDLSGEELARRLYSHALVDQVLRLQYTSAHMVVQGFGRPW